MSVEMARLTARNLQLERENERLRNGIPVLSKREREVYLLMAKGAGPTEIGEKLFLSVKTIGTYRARLFEKLGLVTNADLTIHAIRNRVITAELLPVEECMSI